MTNFPLKNPLAGSADYEAEHQVKVQALRRAEIDCVKTLFAMKSEPTVSNKVAYCDALLNLDIVSQDLFGFESGPGDQ